MCSAGFACALQGRWLPELQRIVGVINDSFSLNFREIGCAGEVCLGINGAQAPLGAAAPTQALCHRVAICYCMLNPPPFDQPPRCLLVRLDSLRMHQLLRGTDASGRVPCPCAPAPALVAWQLAEA